MFNIRPVRKMGEKIKKNGKKWALAKKIKNPIFFRRKKMVVLKKKKWAKNGTIILKRPKNEAKKKNVPHPQKKMGKKMGHRKKCPFSLN